MFKTITRGGQLNLHNLRMMRQVALSCVLISGLSGLGTTAWLSWKTLPPYAITQVMQTYGAEVRYFALPPSQHYKSATRFTMQDGKVIYRRTIDVVYDPYTSYIREKVFSTFASAGYKGGYVSLFLLLSLLMFWTLKGVLSKRNKKERGASYADSKALAARLYAMLKASDLKLDHLPLVKDKETSHMLVTGTTGAGKTNLFHTLLPQIRKRGDAALIVDLTGDFVKRYYREGQDILLNPFDSRSVSWSIWDECKTEPQADTFAQACIPPSNFSNDKFWDTAGAVVLSTAIQKIAKTKNPSIEKLYDTLARADAVEYHKFFFGTDAASFTDLKGEKTTHSIRAGVNAHIKFLKHLKSGGIPFSMRSWVQKERKDQWVFLTAGTDERVTLRPLLSALINVAINSLMTLPPCSQRRLWFMIDELPALNRLPSLENGLAESRKYGGCFLAGIQSIAQLTNLYGHQQAQTMLDLFNTMTFFRNTDPQTTGWISKVLGEQEMREAQENLSYGANTMRDGISLSEVLKQRTLILPTEVSTLKDLECFVKLPEGLPITKIRMEYKK